MKRRTVLAGGVALGTSVPSAGCLGTLGSSDSKPDPIDLSGTKKDDQGGMVIGKHGGPNGQIFYENNAPDHGNPAWFHTLTYGMFPYYFEHEQLGWTAEAIYVTDYSLVDYDPPTEGGLTLPAPTAADTFGDAKTMTYVVESRARGGMGPAIVPFSRESDADSFAETYGGRTLAFDDISPEFVSQYQ
jgi:nitrous oxide reductase accessory protein NosL